MTTITTELAQQLREAAEKATQGTWHADDGFIGHSITCAVDGSNKLLATVEGANAKADMAFIALANPANVLVLLDALEEAEYQRENIHRVNCELFDKVCAAEKHITEQQPVADVVAWSHPDRDRTCDIRWHSLNVEPGPLYRSPQSAPKTRTGLAKSLSHGEYKWLDRFPELTPYESNREQSNRQPVVFISGPMTGYKNFNRDEFDAEARAMGDRGYIVLNPAILPDGLQHEQYMSITLAMLRQADAVLMLKGWHESKGARLELDLAIRLGLVVLTESWSAMGEVIKRNPLRNGGDVCTQ